MNTSLDGFSLANHGQFAKFGKLSCYTVCYVVSGVCYIVSGVLLNSSLCQSEA